MIAMNVSISDTVSRDLRSRMAAVQNGRGLMAACAGEARRTLQDHFEKKNTEGNKSGWPSNGFWADVRRSTGITTISETAATVTVSDPRISMKITGGRVTPKRGKTLAIPMTAEAYAAGSPRELGESLVVKVLGPAVFLARAPQTAISYKRLKNGTLKAVRGKETFEELLYRLVPSADIPKDATALPPPATMDRNIQAAAAQFLDRETRRAR